MKTKICTKCKRELSVSCFSKAKKGLYGKRAQCKECSAKYTRAWRENNVALMRERERRRVKRVRKKPYRLEHNTVNRYVKKGSLIKPLFCVRCWQPGILHGHHTDYSRPLDVIWLCPACHGREHGERVLGVYPA